MQSAGVPVRLPCARPASGAGRDVRRGPVHRADRQHAITFVGLKKGDTIAFGKRDIVDWIYMDAGVMKGNYSACAVLKAALPRDRAAFKRRFGLEFDF